MTDEQMDTEAFGGWVVLELMGHRRVAGHLAEVQIAGEGFLRFDAYGATDTEPVMTQMYRPAAVYCITPTTERIARAYMSRVGAQPPIAQFEIEVRTCRKCGCTDAEACDDGCYWVSSDLCSNCIEGGMP